MTDVMEIAEQDLSRFALQTPVGAGVVDPELIEPNEDATRGECPELEDVLAFSICL